MEASSKKGTFVGYCENSKAYKIYVPGKRNIKFSKDVTFDEDAALGKARDTPLPPVDVNIQDDVFEIQENTEPKSNPVDEPMEPMDPLDSPPYDPLAKRRSLWLRDTLHDVDKHVAPR